MKTTKRMLLAVQDTETLDMRIVGALAKVLTGAFRPTVRRDRAEFEALASLGKADLLIDEEWRVPLNFASRLHPPELFIDVEHRGFLDGLRLEILVETFLGASQGNTEARLLSRFGLTKIVQCCAKYGFIRDAVSNVREFANLDAHENAEASWGAAFSLVTPDELEQRRLEVGRVSGADVASIGLIDIEDASLIAEKFEAHRDELLSPRLPQGWRQVQFVESLLKPWRRRP